MPKFAKAETAVVGGLARFLGCLLVQEPSLALMPDAKDEDRIQCRIVAVHRDIARSTSRNYQLTAQRVALATDERVFPQDGHRTLDPLDGGDGGLGRQLERVPRDAIWKESHLRSSPVGNQDQLADDVPTAEARKRLGEA